MKRNKAVRLSQPQFPLTVTQKYSEKKKKKNYPRKVIKFFLNEFTAYLKRKKDRREIIFCKQFHSEVFTKRTDEYDKSSFLKN